MRKLSLMMVALMMVAVVAGCSGPAEEPESAPASDKNQGIRDTSSGASSSAGSAKKDLEGSPQ